MVPKLKKSATSAISLASSAARGTSIIVPTRYGTFTPDAARIRSATRTVIARRSASSRRKPTSGIMISGLTSTPFFFTATAASMMASTCIS